MIAQVKGKGKNEVSGRMKLEKGVSTIAVEGLEWMSEADSRKKTVAHCILIYERLLNALHCL